MFKKKIPWMILFIVIAALSIGTIVTQCKSFSLYELIHDIKDAYKGYLVLAILCMLGFIFFEGMAIQYLVRHLTPNRKNRGGWMYAASDIYFSAITPSATGGQPASALFMIRDGIAPGATTVILLINLVMYTAALLTVGLGVVIAEPTLFLDFDLLGECLICIGYFILALLGTGFILILTKPHWLRGIGNWLIHLGEKIHLIHHGDKKREHLDQMIHQYRNCVELVKGKWKILLVTFCFNLLQRMCLMCISMFAYLAQHGMKSHALDVLKIQILTCVGSNSVPIPGAMGAADYLLFNGLESIPGVQSVANLELLSRGISFYLCVILSLVIMVCGYIKRKRKTRG